MSIAVNPYLMLLVFIVFLITLYLLTIWLYKPLIAFMDNRENCMKQDLQCVQDDSKEIVKIDREIKQIIENARLEAYKIITQATNEAKNTCETKITKKKAEASTKFEEFSNEIQVHKQKLKNDLLASMLDFENSLKLKISQI